MKGKCDKDKNQVCRCPAIKVALLRFSRTDGRAAESERRELIAGINLNYPQTPRPDQYPRMWENVRFVWIGEIVERV
jgi:hypothetical protein